MEIIICRRWFSSLPPIKVEIGAEFENSPEGIKLGAAIKVLASKARDKGTGADLTGANLTRADLTDADLTRADLTGADLTYAVLTDADLTDANLTDADLTRANLIYADLTRADLTGAVLTRADLTATVLTDADLTRADLTDANLTDADLTRADLTGAVLTRADLTATVLTDAVLTDAIDIPSVALRPVRVDFFDVLLRARAEVPALLLALREGRIDGSTYRGECACLAGTIRNVRGCDLDDLGFVDSNRPIERWFMAIRRGHTPQTHQVAKITEQWILEFQALMGEAAS